MNVNIYRLSKLISKQIVLANKMFLDGKHQTESNYLKLYTAIIDDEVSDDKESIELLGYQDNVSAFKKLKYRYTEKLFDYILIGEHLKESSDNLIQLYLRLIKLFSVARILHNIQNKKDAVVIYEYVFNLALKHEFLDLQFLVAKDLNKHYAYIAPNESKRKKYDPLSKNALEYINREFEINLVYDMISHGHAVKKLSTNEDFKADVLIQSEALLDSIAEDELYINKSMIYGIASYAYNINNLHEKSIEISKKSIESAQNSEAASNVRLFFGYKDLVDVYLKLADFNNALHYVQLIVDMLHTKGYNYFNFMKTQFAIFAHMHEVDQMYITTQEIIRSKQLKEYNRLQEGWMIREAFCNLFVEAGLISDQVKLLFPTGKFRIKKFANEVETYSKDKRGTNIAILVVQLMHHLIRKEYSQLSDKLDALNQYSFRYLKNDDTLRSNCFIKMLLKLPEAEFHPLRTKRYVQRYEKKLQDNPLKLSLNLIDVEIVPYEFLWSIISNILESNLKKSKASKSYR